METLYFWLVIAIVVAEFIYSTVLTALNAKASKLPIPAVLEGLYDSEKYAKQQSYSSTRRKFGLISATVSTAVTLSLFAFGGFALFDSTARACSTSPIIQCLIFWGIFYIVSWLISIPFDSYSTFVIEQHFGFNRTTKKIFIADLFKGLVLNALISGAVLALCTWVYTLSPKWFWLYAWIGISLFSLFFQYFYSQLIVPLFNKQTPLPEGELRTAIEAFTTKADFTINGIFVMDSSKRSTHANAYFTGFGRKKRVVLYDTLIEQLNTEEIVAVLAHETGHSKHGHIVKSMLTGFATNLVMLFLLSLVIGSRDMAAAAGCSEASFHVNLAVFSLIYTPINILLDICSNIISRRRERQADAFAIKYGLGPAESSALKKMSAKSLSNLTPHPAVVFAEYSHPTLAERVTYLNRCNGEDS